MTLESLNMLDHVRQSFNASTSRIDRSQIGQFLTPASIADFMSSLFEAGTREVRILDPGAGAGVLFAACVDKLLSQKKRSLSIEVVAYETDRAILPYLQETMDRCAILCASRNVSFNGIIKEDDFIASAIAETVESLFSAPGRRFTGGPRPVPCLAAARRGERRQAGACGASAGGGRPDQRGRPGSPNSSPVCRVAGPPRRR